MKRESDRNDLVCVFEGRESPEEVGVHTGQVEG